MSEFGTNFDVIRHPATQRWIIAVGVGAPAITPQSITPPEGGLYYDKAAQRFYSFQSGAWATLDPVVDAVTATTVTTTSVVATSGQNLAINSGATNTDLAGKTVRLNSITNTGTSNSLIGFQSKPGQGAATTQNVIGCEISPRVNDGIALTGTGSVIGAHVDTYLRGTTGDVDGDVRGQEIELVTDDAGTRTVAGNVTGLRFRAAFSGTVTGTMVPLRVERAEDQTNSNDWDAVLELTGTEAGIWNDDPATEVDTTAAKGYIKVLVNGATRYIALYEPAPTD